MHDVLVVVGEGAGDTLVAGDSVGSEDGLVVGLGGGVAGEGEGGGEEEGDLGVRGDAVNF